MLALSGVFSAYLQSRHRFLSLALSPLFYMGSLCLGILFFGNKFGILIVGYSAIVGACLHLLINLLYFSLSKGTILFCWKKPQKAWQNFQGDFWRRVFNNSVFQINQSIDIWIASFLVAGAITAFSIGTTFGHALLSIVGYSIANTAFPKLAKAKNNTKKQTKILNRSIKWILFWTIPFAIIGAIGSEFLLKTLFNLDGNTLEMTQKVFFWTVISLPAGSLIPIFSRVFLANDDTHTPLYINFFSLFVATILALILAFKIFPPEKAILGLAYGNFTANILSAVLFYFFLKTKKITKSSKFN
jgi:putative peptidoglycan lipid II flippase